MPPLIDGVKLRVGAKAVAAAYFRGVNVAGSPVEPFRVASADNIYPDNNPAVSPISNAGADSAAFVAVYKLEQDYSSLSGLFYNDQFGTGSGAGPGNAVTLIDAAMVYNGVAVPLMFDGSRSIAMADNARGIACSEPAAADFGVAKFAKGSIVKIKGRINAANLGDNFVRSNQATTTHLGVGGTTQGQYVLYNRATASLSSTDADGVYTFVTGSAVTSGSAGCYMPVLVGRAINRKKLAFLALGDSIPTRYLGSAVLHEQFADGVFPSMRVTVPGCDVKSFNDFPDNWSWLLPYVDDVLIHLGDNDIAASASAWGANNSYDFWPTLRQRYLDLWATIGAKRIHQSHHLMPSTSTDTWATVNGQTPVPHWEPVFAQSEPWLDARVSDGAIYRALDVSPVRATNASGKDVWAADGVTAKYNTADGIHLSNNGDNGTASIATSGVGRYNAGALMPALRAAAVAAYGTDAPTPALNVAVTPSNASATTTWAAPEYSGGAAYTYRAEYKLSSSGTWLVAQSGISAASTSHEYTGLTNNQQYDFRIVSVNSAGETASASVSATPTAVAYDPNLSSVFDASATSSITEVAGAISSWGDARGSSINYAQSDSAKRPVIDAGGVRFAANKILTLDQTSAPGNFDIVFKVDSAISKTSTAANIIHFANAAPASLASGSSTGTFTDEVLVFSIGTYRAAVSESELIAKTGSATIDTTSHVVSVRYTSGAVAKIWLDGVSMTVVENGSNTQTLTTYTPTIGGDAAMSRDLLGVIYEIRHYSAAPVTPTADIHAELMAKW